MKLHQKKAPGFSEFIRKLDEKYILKKQLRKTEIFILKNETIMEEDKKYCS